MDTIFSIIRSLTRTINTLLPFTNRSTPLLQDILHTLILCTALYYAPRISQWYQARKRNQTTSHHDDNRAAANGPDIAAIDHDNPNIPHDIGIVIEPSDTESEHEQDGLPPPPQAPTPPPNPQPLPADPQAQPLPPAAGAHHPRPTPANRTIGTKKAASLARKDQRRAYHEFLQNEREQRRLAEAEGAAEREAALLAKKQRRAEIEAEIAERERKEREKRKEEERREMEEETRRRERVVRNVKVGLEEEGYVDLGVVAGREGKDRVWVEKVVRAGGILNSAKIAGDGVTMITKEGWVVRLDAEFMKEVYWRVLLVGKETGCRIELDKVGDVLEHMVMERAKG